ncbi:YciI family protein [Nocardia farcinica]|uniref:YciI-like protein n=1 Tax=Nocardia farcinica TaxID=37329 RepID=A0A449GPC2_NOCFR|nr:YciI family protein [Nocardia farcinica]SLH57889.1 YciI-like protein [Mycobacteroides abscessus subsp. abscessus]VFA94430.1 YciI-like protein [Nocardia farcinica]
MRYVLFYESADDVMPLAMRHFPAHQAHWQPFAEAGTLLGIGTFGDPQTEGSMAIFRTREAAEEFARADPFVLNGVVKNWVVRAWDDAMST